MSSLRQATHHAIPMISGTIITATGHSGRLRSCSIVNNKIIAKGIAVMQSSNPVIILHSRISSGEVRKYVGRYHKWHKVMVAKNAAVHRRRRTGGVTSGAKALPRRKSR